MGLTETDIAQAAARLIQRALADKPELVLALPTGRTPLPLYRELVRRCGEGQLSFRAAHTFNLDELKGIDPEDPASFHAYLKRHLYEQVDLAPHRTHFLDGTVLDAAAQCERYERELSELGGLDLAVVGIGQNGHVAFNEPADELSARTHVVKLAQQTRLAHAPLFGGDAHKVPLEAYTMGMATLLKARTVVLIATGASKAEILARALEGPITTRCPASLLQLHPALHLLADDAAAARLGSRA